MKHLPRIMAAIAVAAVAAACTQKTDKAPVAKVDVVATVDGQAIDRYTFNEFVKNSMGKPAEDLTAEQRTQLLDNLVRAVAVARDAETSGIAKKEEIRFALEMARLQILYRAVSQNYLKDRTPSEDELRAEYNLRIAGLSKLRYRASHILVPTEEAGKQVIAQLQKGASFEQLARANSTDSASKDKGGDLDWFTPDSMTPAFSEAVQKLKKGEITAAPVQTNFGWHVIRLTDTADNPPPPYESVKDRLVQAVEEKKFRAYVDTMMTKVKVEKKL